MKILQDLDHFISKSNKPALWNMIYKVASVKKYIIIYYKRDSMKQLDNLKFAMKMTLYNTALENFS